MWILRLAASCMIPVAFCAAAMNVGAGTACADEKDAAIAAWESTYQSDVLPILRERCAECHRGDEADGGFDLDRFAKSTRLAKKSDVWDSVGKRLRLNEMPPSGSPGLNDHQKSILHRWLDAKPGQDLCNQIATDETKAWYRGYVMSRRLTRTEYVNAMRDLIGIAIRDPSSIPSDGSGGEGFDTAGDSLFTSTIHIEQYLSLASQMIDSILLAPAQNASEGRSPDQLAARERLFAPTDKNSTLDRNAASTIVSTFARRAWRRPIGSEELERLLALYDHAKSRDAEFDTAVGQSLKAVLISPNFLFVVETETAKGGVQRLTPHQLATRMALLIWSSIPDDELLDAADAGELDTDEQVIAQTRRMLADPKARAIGENFGLQWLGLANFMTAVRPDDEVYPEFNEQLAGDLREEAIRMVWRLFSEDRSLLEVIDSDSIEINGRLASHYGVNLPDDSSWQRVKTNDRRRGGVITLGAVLMSSSYPRRTSPVLRGRWMLEEVLGDRVPPPPPGVPALDAVVAERPMTLRERLELHRQSPVCASCHDRMDPLGFGLENFDGLGRWRDKDGEADINATGKLPSGESFDGPEQLKQILMTRSSDFETHFVKKIVGFALGRALSSFDDCVIQDCRKALAANDHRASYVLETIVTSYPFQHRFFKAAESAAESDVQP
ncbi:DUF1592 domain-containing protein [Rubripirellula reticaptiva]|uniref:Planctomycete cytochrome C n=1 Tax=Rubripirellula reticaptiva TaxID=2528013 RepID=A0A5C6EQF2_9BACT|nr:DUF1592 domain-containing protein [Rubripirellula reticaptiva]TWU51292.1 Planctomycete cytochrome C [Rubripirellula reticaptiva]